MFNLADLAAEVAREKPNGEKNALRKTYKGHIKRLGVAGHFDVQKKKEDAPSEFMAMLQVPDLEWNVHQVKGREIGDGLSEATRNSLNRAMTLSKGPIARSVWDTTVLGELAPSSGDGKSSGPNKGTGPNTPAATTPSSMERSKGPVAPGSDPNRPRRNIKKRTYGDSSYEGYGEGFPDDDGGADTGYSTGEGEGGQKRRKKVSSSVVCAGTCGILTCAAEFGSYAALSRSSAAQLRSWHGRRVSVLTAGRACSLPPRRIPGERCSLQGLYKAFHDTRQFTARTVLLFVFLESRSGFLVYRPPLRFIPLSCQRAAYF